MKTELKKSNSFGDYKNIRTKEHLDHLVVFRKLFPYLSVKSFKFHIYNYNKFFIIDQSETLEEDLERFENYLKFKYKRDE